MSTAACQLTKQLIREWALARDRPFPYLQVGEHLKNCLSCLNWSTGIAYRPGDRYLSALRLKLSDVLSYLGSSLLAVWSADQDVKISFCLEPENVPRVREKALKFLTRYQGFSPATAREAATVQEMIGHADAGSGLARLEPYELVRYFFTTALELASAGEQSLSLLVNLGITENYQALNERRAGHEDRAAQHFRSARDFLGRVLKVDVRVFRAEMPPEAETRNPKPETLNPKSGIRVLNLGFRASREADRTALVSARINFAGTEVQQENYSEPSLHKAVNLLHEAGRLVPELGLQPSEFTAIYSNLLISYLRLYLDHGLAEGLTQARRLVDEISAQPVLSRAFLADCIREQSDPELNRLLAAPQIHDLAAHLREQAGLTLGA